MDHVSPKHTIPQMIAMKKSKSDSRNESDGAPNSFSALARAKLARKQARPKIAVSRKTKSINGALFINDMLFPPFFAI